MSSIQNVTKLLSAQEIIRMSSVELHKIFQKSCSVIAEVQDRLYSLVSKIPAKEMNLIEDWGTLRYKITLKPIQELAGPESVNWTAAEWKNWASLMHKANPESFARINTWNEWVFPAEALAEWSSQMGESLSVMKGEIKLVAQQFQSTAALQFLKDADLLGELMKRHELILQRLDSL